MIKLQLIVLAICIVETITERYVIALKGSNSFDQNRYHRLNRLEHWWSAIYFVLIVFGLWLMNDRNDWPFLLTAPLIRFMCLTFLLNVLRFPPKPFFYLGKDGIDGMLKSIFRKNAGLIAFIICIISITAINIFL